MRRNLLLIATLVVATLQVNLVSQASLAQEEKEVTPIRALIVDGQNNHRVWPKTSQMMRSYLEESGRFQVDIATTAPQGTDPDFQPEFENYQVIISNYNGADWPESTQAAFVDYMKNGGGLVVVHAADNAFSKWTEYNKMIGLGGWGGRNEVSGPLVYFDGNGKEIRDDSAGRGGSHGKQHPFSVVSRNDEHPIMQGLPVEWLHAQDELYDRLRGPAENMTVLATSFSQPKFGGTGRHEPMLMTINYEKGRVFHSPMGHAEYSMECVGFITTFLRGAEWAATGEVTIPVPEDFPTPDKVSKRSYLESVVKTELGETRNVTRVGNLFLAGQPTEADIEVIQGAGISEVITLRTDGEVKWDEQKAVQEAGMKFSKIEFRQPDQLTDEVFDAIREKLKATSNEKVLLHCGSANRVGAVWATYRVLDQGVEAEKAMSEAKKIGLRSEGYIQRVQEYLAKQKKDE